MNRDHKVGDTPAGRGGDASGPHPRSRRPAFGALFTALMVCAVLILSCGSSKPSSNSSPSNPPSPPVTGQWTLVWSDEFSGTNGSLPDSGKWVFDTGGGGWGNNELESYTDRPENAHQQDGNLIVTAIKETFTGADGITRDYTSARIKTAGKFTQQYGRFEARIKLPAGQGIWPAFWMLGDNIGTVGWPSCGEIDIMENVGYEPSVVHGSLHGPAYSGGASLTGTYTLPNSQKFSDGFHVFAVEWETNAVRFYVDDQLYETRTSADVPAGGRWAFDHPFFLILNVAVGGNWPGSPDATTVFPQSMQVDYVRVYART